VNGRLSHPLKIGKWYFECKIANDAITAILGFGTNELLSDVLSLQLAIGRCEYSWGFQLITGAAWYEILFNLIVILFFISYFIYFYFVVGFGCFFNLSRHGHEKLKYASQIKPAKGGIVQIYLDCDEKKIAYGYNGEYLGMILPFLINFELTFEASRLRMW
jgi:hypothetical protein